MLPEIFKSNFIRGFSFYFWVLSTFPWISFNNFNTENLAFLSSQTIMRGLLPPDKQHQAEERALEDAEEEADIFEAEVERWKILVLVRQVWSLDGILIGTDGKSITIGFDFQVNFLFALLKKGRMPRSYLRQGLHIVKIFWGQKTLTMSMRQAFI